MNSISFSKSIFFSNKCQAYYRAVLCNVTVATVPCVGVWKRSSLIIHWFTQWNTHLGWLPTLRWCFDSQPLHSDASIHKTKMSEYGYTTTFWNWIRVRIRDSSLRLRKTRPYRSFQIARGAGLWTHIDILLQNIKCKKKVHVHVLYSKKFKMCVLAYLYSYWRALCTDLLQGDTLS